MHQARWKLWCVQWFGFLGAGKSRSMATAIGVLPPRYGSPELVARGGMAEVYRATDRVLGRLVAVKVLSVHLAADEGIRTRFMREAQMAAILSGARNIVTIFDVGDLTDGRPYIVMEYLGGGSVADRLRVGPISPPQAIEWLEQAARGLDGAHAVGIVHRDVKPANLLLTLDDEVKVTDFGIARAAVEGSLTATGMILGTSGYMSPEQALGEQVTAASDCYALAVVAFELLTGSRPFEGDSQVSEAFSHAYAPIPRATSRNHQLPLMIDSVLAGGLAKEPRARPKSCGRLVDSLRRVFDYHADLTRRITPVVAHATRPRRSRELVWVTAAIGLALLAAAATAFATLISREQTPQSVQTIVRTQTVSGEAQTRTVTVPSRTTKTQTPAKTTKTQTSPLPDTSTGVNSARPSRSGASFNDEGYSQLRRGNVDAALPLLERAVQLLAGNGSVVEAYASYNLALARYGLGRCDGVLELLDRSEHLQGKRAEIIRLRKDVQKRCD